MDDRLKERLIELITWLLDKENEFVEGSKHPMGLKFDIYKLVNFAQYLLDKYAKSDG
jgi:hypothetical protein